MTESGHFRNSVTGANLVQAGLSRAGSSKSATPPQHARSRQTFGGLLRSVRPLG